MKTDRIRSESWLKRKETKNLLKKEFRERFGRAFRSRVRLPDEYVPKFLDLKAQLGHKSDQETVEWLMNQAAPALHQLLGTQQEKESDPINVNNTYQVNQVWALWDDRVDGMPRSYARIHKLFPADLKAQVVFLEPVPTTDNETQWSLDNNLPMACGTFKEGASTTTVDVFAFSHQVNIGVGSIYHRIFPHKGEVWAVFKDWNINWTLHDFMARTRYEFVEVDSYICEGNGVAGVCLTRVGLSGYVFERHGENVQFSGKELLRFSHRVPASKVGGKDECWELNPAALPLYLF